MTTFREQCRDFIAGVGEIFKHQPETPYRELQPRGRVRCESFSCGGCKAEFGSFAALDVHECPARRRR